MRNSLLPCDRKAASSLNPKALVDYHRNRKLAFTAIKESYA